MLETTEGPRGPTSILIVFSGDSSEVELRFIVRDFENDLPSEHVEFLRRIAAEVAATDPRAARSRSRPASSTATCATPRAASRDRRQSRGGDRRLGLEPRRTAIRGRTDRSALTEMGLPTPNIFTGGHDAHSEREWICVEDMGLAAAAVVEPAKSGPKSGRFRGGARLTRR